MIALKKIWAFLKTYWYIPVLIIVALVLRSKGNKISDILGAAKDSHEKQLKAIEDVEKEKAKRKQEIEEEYKNAIKKINENYSKNNKAINEREREYVKEVIKSWSDDPGQMAERITVKFGFQYVPKTNHNNSD